MVIPFKYKALPLKRLLKNFLNERVDFKFPDRPYWQKNKKAGVNVFYSKPVADFIDGVMVVPTNRGKSLKTFKKLGILLGFTPWDYMELIAKKKIKVYENRSFKGLLKQCMIGRVDGIYVNVMVCNYQLREDAKNQHGLVFDPGLPHTKSSYLLSTIKYPEVINSLDEFLIKKSEMVESLKIKFKINVKNQ